MEDITEGDVVRLKSGGPNMTVEYAGPQMIGVISTSGAIYQSGESNESVTCVWFEKTTRKTGKFKRTTLVKVHENK